MLDSSDLFPLDVNEAYDTDLDGIGNNADTDDDGDGVLDGSDAFPLDATEYRTTTTMCNNNIAAHSAAHQCAAAFGLWERTARDPGAANAMARRVPPRAA